MKVIVSNLLLQLGFLVKIIANMRITVEDLSEYRIRTGNPEVLVGTCCELDVVYSSMLFAGNLDSGWWDPWEVEPGEK